jgi:hypothetical protein
VHTRFSPGNGRDHVWGKIQRCDWLKITCSLEIYTVHTRFSPGKGGDHDLGKKFYAFRVWGFHVRGKGLRVYGGRGEPLPLTLSFGTLSFADIPWFDVWGEIQRCDWLKRTHSLEIYTGHIQKNAFFDQSQRCIFPRTSNHGVSPKDSVSDSG